MMVFVSSFLMTNDYFFVIAFVTTDVTIPSEYLNLH